MRNAGFHDAFIVTMKENIPNRLLAWLSGYCINQISFTFAVILGP
jgi:hypothetical protein